MANYVKIKKGLDIPIVGKPSNKLSQAENVTHFAISPSDFPGPVWKSAVKEGDIVEIGSALLYAKNTPSLKLTSPVAGTVTEVRRGERRKILYVVVEKNQTQVADNFTKRILIDNSETADDENRVRTLLQISGLWSMMRQRPFDIVPAPDSKARDIFITAFDSAPLAGPILTPQLEQYLNDGIKVLSKLTSGKIYLGISPEQNINVDAAEVYVFDGPHPSGNIGTHISAICPVNKGETVWTLDAATAARIGKLIKEDCLDTSTTVALSGEEINEPSLVATNFGASLKELLNGKIKPSEENIRVISGNVLTGIKVNENDDFLHYPYRQITIIPEGNNADEFMGWASLKPGKYSVKRSFPNFLKGLSHSFNFDARIKGGHRAPILSGEYDKVFPFDIYPEYLLRAIQAGDIDKMEKLGIYEVAPEDFALAEFVDTSKIPLQEIVRNGLDNLRKELE